MSRPIDHQPADAATLRVEDAALLRGGGCFSGDLVRSGQVVGVFVRSHHARARINRVDVAAAAALPGVLAVLHAADMSEVGNLARPPLLNLTKNI
jgi:carbon-monoxide dehydrogenase large subunit